MSHRVATLAELRSPEGWAAVRRELGVSAFGINSALGYLPFAFIGAAIASVVVYLLGSAGRSGATPVRLALAGVAVTAALSAEGVEHAMQHAGNLFSFAFARNALSAATFTARRSRRKSHVESPSPKMSAIATAAPAAKASLFRRTSF